MQIKLTLHSAAELTAAAAFCTALAEARKDAEERGFFGIDSLWENVSHWRNAKHPRTDADLAEGQEHADDVKFPEPQAEQPAPRRRGRPRKDAQPVETAEPGQIDIEEAIATTITAEDAAAAIADDKPVEEIVAEAQTSPDTDEQPVVQDAAPTPADPEAGWTTADARNAGRALLDRAPDTESGNRALAALLQPFAVMQVKLLKTEQIEAFVIAANGKVF